MILGDLINLARTLAEASCISEADYLYVLEAYMELSRTDLILQRNKQVSSEQETAVLSAFMRLQNHEPPQHISGKAPFFHLDIYINSDVLIPRPETEGLVELVLNRISSGQSILDIGTGSGAIAIALKSISTSLMVDAIDISPEALQIANINAKRNQVDVRFFLGDLFPTGSSVYDVIVSNPPYISASEMEQLDPRVKDFEPVQALYGGEDGLDIYRKLLAEGGKHLNQNGFMALEHGALQREQITALAKLYEWGEIEAYQDLQGRDRYLLIHADKNKITRGK